MAEKKLCLLTLVLTFLLVLLGGYVHNTESSLACPDWPLCYGQFFPPMEGGILIEHSHRLLASLVGLLTLLVAFFTWRNPERAREDKWLAIVAVIMVVCQGLLGGITVLYKLPTIVSTSHLSLAMIFFLTVLTLYHRLGRDTPHTFRSLRDDFDKKSWNPNVKTTTLCAITVLYFQIVLGAMTRHTGAGVACGVGPERALKCFDMQTWALTWWPSAEAAQLHMLHRFMALVATLFILWSVISTFRQLTKVIPNGLKNYSALWVNTWAPVFLVCIQVVLGILTVAKSIDPIITMLHLGFAALTLLFLWRNYLDIKSCEMSLFGRYLPSLLEDFAALTKPKLSALVALTALIGMLLAPSPISFFTGFTALLGIILIVGGACAINCYIERDIDRKMERTKDRPLAAKRIPANLGALFGVLLFLIGFPLLYFAVNPLTAFLGFLGCVLYLFAYTPLKLKTDWSLYIGAIPGAIPPVLGYTSATGRLELTGVILFLILFIWQIPHFLAIAIYRFDDFKNANIKTFAQRGLDKTKFYMIVLTVLLLVASLLPTVYGNSSIAYRNVALSLGVAFLALAFWGSFVKSSSLQTRAWAHTYFYGSLFYLPALLSSMIFLR